MDETKEGLERYLREFYDVHDVCELTQEQVKRALVLKIQMEDLAAQDARKKTLEEMKAEKALEVREGDNHGNGI